MGTKLKFFTAFHHQTDGQSEIINRSLGNLLRCLVGEHLRNWDLTIPTAEFVYNSSCNRSIGMSPFEVVRSCKPRKFIDLILMTQHPRVSESASHLHHIYMSYIKKN